MQPDSSSEQSEDQESKSRTDQPPPTGLGAVGHDRAEDDDTRDDNDLPGSSGQDVHQYHRTGECRTIDLH